jgi:hypothetical protein
MSMYRSDEEIAIHRMHPESTNNQVRLVCGKGLATPVDGRLQIAKYSPRWQYVTCHECLIRKPEIGTKAVVGERIHWRLSALVGLTGACRTKAVSYASTDPADVTCPKCIDGWVARREGRRP